MNASIFILRKFPIPQRGFALALLVLAVAPAAAQTRDQLTRSFMICVRQNAEVLEAAEDPPMDVARAAVFLCQREEGAAINADPANANRLRETALFYGAAQATIARACRRANRCGLAPTR